MVLEQEQQELLRIIGLVHLVILEVQESELHMRSNTHGVTIEKLFRILGHCLKTGLYQLHHDIF